MATNPTRPHSYFRKENKDAIARAADNIVGRRPTDGGQVPFARLPPECNTRLRIIKFSTGKWAIYLKRSERDYYTRATMGSVVRFKRPESVEFAKYVSLETQNYGTKVNRAKQAR